MPQLNIVYSDPSIVCQIQDKHQLSIRFPILANLRLWLTGKLIVRLASLVVDCRLLSVVCHLSQFSNIISSETIEPTEVKFHVEHPWDEGAKVCSRCPDHMTKVAAMSI